ncbi:GNAT family N-acetyltransferase [Planococcus lenghuensis]|uniref:GNAT family N-acetyltransferase n=1 Tax=Planococcus lenghuensis TaxID=2213202 RepID=A0A1Q2KYT2_9BACL|nr:GNAT family N-acetyltransferase [Planococcus lenghuensis]AQQ53360.1 GNAT family N-acetyltransferase [Planococcus lenghuensis]
MLVKYKKSCEKIAMGLLGLMPNEQKVKKLQALIRLYEEKPERQLYLWKEEDDYVGLIGVEVEEAYFVIRHIAVNPSHQGEGLGHVMTEQVQQCMQPREMLMTPEAEERMLTAC